MHTFKSNILSTLVAQRSCTRLGRDDWSYRNVGGRGWGTTVAFTFIFSKWQTIEYLFEGSIKMEGLVIIKTCKNHARLFKQL